jgi:hypothetical protein
MSISQIEQAPIPIDEEPPITEGQPDVTIFKNETLGREMGGELKRLGLMTGGAGVVQVDIMAATWSENPETGYDRPLCDHNCDHGGGYQCPARRSAHPGLKTSNLAPAEKISRAIDVAVEGLKKFNQRFTYGGHLRNYGNRFCIPQYLQDGIAYNLQIEPPSINIFGGNPELHPDVLDIAQACHDSGYRTTLTTTGAIMMNGAPRGKEIQKSLLAGSINTLAVSAEYQNANQIRQLMNMSTEEMKRKWRESDLTGQARKGIEAIDALRYHLEHQGEFTLLMNLVVHPGNLGFNGEGIEDIIATLKELDPTVKVNPYPAQSSFDTKDSDTRSNIQTFSPEHIPALTSFIAQRIKEQTMQDSQTVLRPHYWAMLKAVLDTSSDDPEQAAKMLSGFDVWKCFQAPDGLHGAGHSVQIGASTEPRDLKVVPDAGGYLSCFWNDRTTTRNGIKVWEMTPDDVADHIDGGMQTIAAVTSEPCQGCLMPRLIGDIHSLELGMNPALKDAYLANRTELVGF